MRTFSLSANIENGFAKGAHYIVTPNAQKAIQNIVNDFRAGIHSFTIIGSYGTGKSSFLLALESDLKRTNKTPYLLDAKNLFDASDVEIMNIVGDYTELSTLLYRNLNVEGSTNSVLDELKAYYNRCQKQDKSLVIVVDEFGKVLEHAAKNNPEKELYFLQKLAEFVNVPSRQILLLTTLHQNFSTYAKELTEAQINEWKKVKGRFKEITFVEPIEQLLHLAAKQLQEDRQIKVPASATALCNLAKKTGYISDDFPVDTALQLFPLDMFSAYAITTAIQRYGQNERSLFTFLASKGTIEDKCSIERQTYNLENVYDYVNYSFYSFLKDANADSMSWSSMQVAIERVEGQSWDSHTQMLQAVSIVKAIGLLNLFGVAGFRLPKESLAEYAMLAMGISDAMTIIEKLVQKKIIRYAAYKDRVMLFEGTDVDLEAEFLEAGMMVSRPVDFVAELTVYFNSRISPVKAHFYQKGTPRYFDYKLYEEPLDIVPTGDTDGYIELIFSSKKDAYKELKRFSAESEHALIFAYFIDTENIIDHLYSIKKYKYLIENVIKKEDVVAVKEVLKLKEYEESLLNKAISDNLFSYKNRVIWIFRGEEQKVESHRDFNMLLSHVCNEVYSETPVMNNELFNKHKLSGTITAARKSYLTYLVEHSTEENLGFPDDKFPPEKTIYYSLLKNTGLHQNGEFGDAPINEGFLPLWNASEAFLKSTENKARRISELIKILSTQPYKLKQGFLDFWIPTYLFIKRQDYALFDASRGAFIPNVNMEFFDLLQKHPQDFEVKKFAVDGVKLGFFNQYRRFVNLGDEFTITKDSFIETIKPFLGFYARLDDYTKHTRKFDHESTMKFRDVLAKAKDPEKAFFEVLPEALGFNQEKLKQEEFVLEYGNIIQRAIRELRTCYTRLIDRVEERLVDGFNLQSGDYSEYVEEIRLRLANVKVYLLTDKQREFYHHAMTKYDNRTQWYQSICYTILEQRLDALRDEQEEKLVDDLIYMFRTCEKYSSISQKTEDLGHSDAYSFDMVTNRGTDVRTQTYILPERDRSRAAKLEEKISGVLSGDNNIDICTLLAVLNKKNDGVMKKEQVDRLLEVLNEYHSLGIAEQIDYQKFYLYSLITHSTAIEGSTVTEIENQLLFDEGITAKGRSLQEQMMNLDLKAAYERSMQLARKHADFSVDMLKALSALVMKNTGSQYNTPHGSFDASKGDLRLLGVTAGTGGQSYMNFQKVPGKLAEFCQLTNERRHQLMDTENTIDKYLLSFDAHCQLVTIHPWADGNGRMSRLVMNHLQYEFGLVPVKIIKEDKAEYIQALVEARKQDSFEPFREFMMDEHIRNLRKEIGEYKQSQHNDPISIAPDPINTFSDPIKQQLYQAVLRDGSLNYAGYAALIGVSEATIKRRLNELKNEGVIVRIGSNKTGHWEIKKA